MANRLTQEELEAIRKRVEKATDGPWNWDGDLTYRKNGLLEPLMSGGTSGEVLIEENDANFIAHAREDIPKLVAEIERLRERLFVCESLLSEAHDIMDDVHLYETELYEEITKYFDGEEVE